ncbi:hypothetical protein ACK8P5_04795 [Paenibacillus sp. EC2-1]|uniref:hypothetical protein n=1 Tax=Paenibacillus sp. EC2-1 TaxID=3388665 RepID=UPI003BEF3C46
MSLSDRKDRPMGGLFVFGAKLLGRFMHEVGGNQPYVILQGAHFVKRIGNKDIDLLVYKS